MTYGDMLLEDGSLEKKCSVESTQKKYLGDASFCDVWLSSIGPNSKIRIDKCNSTIPHWIKPIFEEPLDQPKSQIRKMITRRIDPRESKCYNPVHVVKQAVEAMMKKENVTLDKGPEEFAFCLNIYLRNWSILKL